MNHNMNRPVRAARNRDQDVVQPAGGDGAVQEPAEGAQVNLNVDAAAAFENLVANHGNPVAGEAVPQADNGGQAPARNNNRGNNRRRRRIVPQPLSDSSSSDSEEEAQEAAAPVAVDENPLRKAVRAKKELEFGG